MQHEIKQMTQPWNDSKDLLLQSIFLVLIVILTLSSSCYIEGVNYLHTQTYDSPCAETVEHGDKICYQAGLMRMIVVRQIVTSNDKIWSNLDYCEMRAAGSRLTIRTASNSDTVAAANKTRKIASILIKTWILIWQYWYMNVNLL